MNGFIGGSEYVSVYRVVDEAFNKEIIRERTKQPCSEFIPAHIVQAPASLWT